MVAYVDRSAAEFIGCSDDELLADLHRAYASDGFLSQYTSQTIAWEESLGQIKDGLAAAIQTHSAAAEWRILLEFPLYRLRHRIDLVMVTGQAVVVIELKVGASRFVAGDRAQVEEYALDLRDFHEFSGGVPIVPVLWCTEAPSGSSYLLPFEPGVAEWVVQIGAGQFARLAEELARRATAVPRVVREDWARGAYKPVPSVIEAATTLFAGHSVAEITRADAANLDVAAERVASLIQRSREERRRALIFVTGVPGSGKTLAGLQVVHRAVEGQGREAGDVTYLSGNTPLVTVLREALTEDQYGQLRRAGRAVRKQDVRASMRARIQHIMDFLKQHLMDPEDRPPPERAIVFDEAQRAWDAAYGKQKFGRSASEPRLLLDIMARHEGWSVIVGLIGGGQEINSGENGIAEWGDAIRSLSDDQRAEWRVFGPPGITSGDRASAFLGLGELPGVEVREVEDLTLTVPMRSYRSPRVTDWVSAVLDGDVASAAKVSVDLDTYPVHVTRDAEAAMDWLRTCGRGKRRFGLVASSTASRLRAEGFGVSLNATDGQKIAQWYLKPPGDVRSSFAMEVVANEYTTQGLELDFVALLWGGDLSWGEQGWVTRRFSGTAWSAANGERRRFLLNSYRVLLTRAREGLVIWVPRGDPDDHTRDPSKYDRTAEFLIDCGATPLNT